VIRCGPAFRRKGQRHAKEPPDPDRSKRLWWGEPRALASRITLPGCRDESNHFSTQQPRPSHSDEVDPLRFSIDPSALKADASTPQLPPTGFVRLSSILAPNGPIPVSRSTWWAGIKDGRYPKPVKLGPRITAWRVEDIRTLIIEGPR
jgi:prophage regulatory protein